MSSASNRLTFASLFSGCGGFDAGFSSGGFACKAAVDIDPSAIEVHRRNFGSSAYTADLARSNAGFELVRNCDVVLAGPPCQGFSTAGKRDYFDPRNQLLLDTAHVAASAQAKIIVVENVTAVLSGSHRNYWIGLKEILRLRGYKTQEFVIGGDSAGLGQIRKRIILLAWNNGREPIFGLPYLPFTDLRSVLSGLDGLPNHEPEYLNRKSHLYLIAKKIKPGQKLSNVRNGPNSIHTWDIPGVFKKVSIKEKSVLEAMLRLRRRERQRPSGDADPVLRSSLEKHLDTSVTRELLSLTAKGYVRKVKQRYDLTHTFNGKFKRLRWDTPSFTVDTRFGDPRYFLHPEEHRGLTVREAARIQGFSDSFTFLGDKKTQFRHVGNAVPPPLAFVIAKMIRNTLLI